MSLVITPSRVSMGLLWEKKEKFIYKIKFLHDNFCCMFTCQIYMFFQGKKNTQDLMQIGSWAMVCIFNSLHMFLGKKIDTLQIKSNSFVIFEYFCYSLKDLTRTINIPLA